MTKDEKELFTNILSEVKNLREENKKFKESIDAKVSVIEKKHVPINLEQDILTVIQNNISKALETSLVGYNSPLNKLAENVVNNYSSEIKTVMNEAMKQTISADEFKQQIQSAFSHRVSRTLISGMEGQIEKASNELKQDPKFKAQATLAIANLVEGFLSK